MSSSGTDFMKKALDEAVQDGRITADEAVGIMERGQARADQVDDLITRGETEKANELLAQSGIRLVETETVEGERPVDVLVTSEGLGDAGMKLIEFMRDRGMNVQVTS